MAHVELAREQVGLHGLGKLGQAQQIGDRAAGAADRLSRGLVGESELLDQPLQALRFLERVEILALDVLDQREGEGSLIGDRADERGDFLESRALRGAPAPLAGYYFIPPSLDRPYEDRLHHALRLDRFGKLG